MRDLTHKEGLGLVLILTLVAALVGFNIYRTSVTTPTGGVVIHAASEATPGAASPAGEIPSASVETPLPAPAAASPDTVVDVAGAVKHPGIFHLSAGSRIADALKAAGGPSSNADTDAVNLAARVEDSTQVYIPKRNEQSGGGAAATVGAASSAVPTGHGSSGARPTRTGSGRGSAHSNKLSDASPGKVNINHAEAADLVRLPGIGPAMAGRILEFRKENHRFQSVDDLMQVSGIGPKKLEKMRRFVAIN